MVRVGVRVRTLTLPNPNPNPNPTPPRDTQAMAVFEEGGSEAEAMSAAVAAALDEKELEVQETQAVVDEVVGALGVGTDTMVAKAAAEAAMEVRADTRLPRNHPASFIRSPQRVSLPTYAC